MHIIGEENVLESAEKHKGLLSHRIPRYVLVWIHVITSYDTLYSKILLLRPPFRLL